MATPSGWSTRQRAISGLVLGLLAALWWPVLSPAGAASVSPDAERRFVELAGAERAAAGLPAYATQGDLAEVARAQATRMAAEGRLYH
ncbi:MAG TPA: hypothetical protein VF230_10120, partial [Acidimicrobiales bacterium]